jgi:hypothetical protein
VHPTSDAEKRCGRLPLLRGKHSVKAAVRWDQPAKEGEYFTIRRVPPYHQTGLLTRPSTRLLAWPAHVDSLQIIHPPHYLHAQKRHM